MSIFLPPLLSLPAICYNIFLHFCPLLSLPAIFHMIFLYSCPPALSARYISQDIYIYSSPVPLPAIFNIIFLYFCPLFPLPAIFHIIFLYFCPSALPSSNITKYVSIFLPFCSPGQKYFIIYFYISAPLLSLPAIFHRAQKVSYN